MSVDYRKLEDEIINRLDKEKRDVKSVKTNVPKEKRKQRNYS